MIRRPPRSPLFPSTPLSRSRIDPARGGTRRHEMLSRGACDEGMSRAVALGAPVDVPAGVYEHRFPLHVPPAEHACVERPAGALRCADHDALEVRDSLKRIVRNVLAALDR